MFFFSAIYLGGKGGGGVAELGKWILVVINSLGLGYTFHTYQLHSLFLSPQLYYTMFLLAVDPQPTASSRFLPGKKPTFFEGHLLIN